MEETTTLELGVEPLWTPKQTAAYLQVSLRTLAKLIDEEEFPVRYLGTGPKPHRRFDPAEIRAWTRSRWSRTTPDQDIA